MASEVKPRTGTPTGIGVAPSVYTVRNEMRSQSRTTWALSECPRACQRLSGAAVAADGTAARRVVARKAAENAAQERRTRYMGPPVVVGITFGTAPTGGGAIRVCANLFGSLTHR